MDVAFLISVSLNVILGFVALFFIFRTSAETANAKFYSKRSDDYAKRFFTVYIAWRKRLTPEEIEYLKQMKDNAGKEEYEIDLTTIEKN